MGDWIPSVEEYIEEYWEGYYNESDSDSESNSDVDSNGEMADGDMAVSWTRVHAMWK